MTAASKNVVEQLGYENFVYQRYTKNRRHTLRGTLALLSGENGEQIIRQIPGFPHIRRAYVLRRGIKRIFRGQPFLVEEKMDGYNVRIFKHRNRLLAATRGGFICPFTTEWTDIWRKKHPLDKFFEQYPEHVLCAEVIGHNPYNAQHDPGLPPGAHLRIFEILNPEGNFLAPHHRYQLLEDYQLPGVPVHGTYNKWQLSELYQLLHELNENNREGVVVKSQDGKRAFKFVTPNSDIRDIREALPVAFDLPSGFFFNRYVRASMFVQELGLDEDDSARRIGRAFLNGCPADESFSEANEVFQIYVQKEETWQALRDMISSHVVTRTLEKEPVTLDNREMIRVRFKRVFQKSTDRYKRMIRGYLHTD